MAALPELLRMAVGQAGIVPFDAERLKRQNILRERLRATEPGMEVVDLLDDAWHGLQSSYKFGRLLHAGGGNLGSHRLGWSGGAGVTSEISRDPIVILSIGPAAVQSVKVAHYLTALGK